MELTHYISNDAITVNPTQNIEQVLLVFKKANYSHLPVVDNSKLIGNIALEDLITIDRTQQTLKDVAYLYEFFFAKETDTLLELFSNYAVNNTSILPLVNQNNDYSGYLDFSDLLGCFADTHFLSAEGSVILLEKKSIEFSMSEICQIVESNQNHVIGCFVFDEKDSKTRITLKVKSTNINELIQSLRRYDYHILNELSDDSYLDDLKKRSEYFIKYLNI